MPMKKGGYVLTAVAVAAVGCTLHKQAPIETAAPVATATLAQSIQEMRSLEREMKTLETRLPPPAAPETPLTEPLGCAMYADEAGRPDHDAESLRCIVDWLGRAQDYLARGGKPTKYTNQAAFDDYRARARTLNARLNKYLAQTRWQGQAAQPEPAPPAAPSAEDAFRQSQQAYLSGMIYYQKGDYDNARAQWKRAVQLNGGNDDAKAGLERIDALLQDR
jgi:hypothetical protein